MTTALPSAHSDSTVTLTDLRRFIQSRQHDDILLNLLQSEFDPLPARAMLHNRLPWNSWRDRQIDGADFHSALISAVGTDIRPQNAFRHLQPALKILRRFGFEPHPRADDRLLRSPAWGIRGKLDLVGRIRGVPALVDIKTVHHIPCEYALLEHSIQASLLFALAWGRPPRSGSDRVAVLYVASTWPHRAFLREVQLPRRFFRVGSRLAAHLLGRN